MRVLMTRGFTMNIDTNHIVAANRSVAADFEQLQEVSAAKSGQLEAGGIFGPSLIVTEPLPEVAAYMVGDIDERDPVRDDTLGKMVKSAFDLMPPDVPDFV
jgi:hypothetical protein